MEQGIKSDSITVITSYDINFRLSRVEFYRLTFIKYYFPMHDPRSGLIVIATVTPVGNNIDPTTPTAAARWIEGGGVNAYIPG